MVRILLKSDKKSKASIVGTVRQYIESLGFNIHFLGGKVLCVYQCIEILIDNPTSENYGVLTIKNLEKEPYDIYKVGIEKYKLLKFSNGEEIEYKGPINLRVEDFIKVGSKTFYNLSNLISYEIVEEEIDLVEEINKLLN